jgi:hypothetical protein
MLGKKGGKLQQRLKEAGKFLKSKEVTLPLVTYGVLYILTARAANVGKQKLCFLLPPHLPLLCFNPLFRE